MFKISIEWCEEDKVFMASSEDIDGLILESDTIAEMFKHLQNVVPMLLEENGQIKESKNQKNVGIDIHLKSHLSDLSTQPQIA